MKIELLLLFCIFTAVSSVKAGEILASACAPDSGGITIRECYRLALSNSPSEAVKIQVIEESRGRYREAVGMVLPHVSFNLLRYKQNVNSSLLPGYLSAENNEQDKLTLVQPLFSGFREYAGISAQKAEKRQRIYEELRFRQTLITDVSDAFYNLIEQKQNIKIYEDINEIIQSRVKDLKNRASVGRSRKSDISNTMVLLYQNEAQLEAARNLQALALKQLEYLTGTAVQTVTDEDCSAAAASDEKIYTEKIAERPDLKAATELVLIASKQVTIAKADYWPGISLNGDYYTNETGKFAGVNWDVYISAELPLLPVVQTAGSVKAASAKSKEAELNLELAKRNALLDVRTAYEVFRSASANNSAYLLAFKSAEENYKLQEQDYKYNLLNNLDLLQAIQFLQGARRDYVHSVYETKRAYWRLMAAAGEDPDNINSND